MRKNPRVTGLLVPLVAIALLGSMAASAQSTAAAPLRVAIVDIDKVSNEYETLSQKRQELEQWLADKEQYRVELEDFAFLSQEKFNEVLQIYELSRPLPEEKAARLEELRNLSADKLKRFVELRAKPQRSTGEDEELDSLKEVADARQQQLADLWQQIVTEYAQRVQQAQGQLLKVVEKVITQYAQEHNYDLVLDAAWVLYGGEDITDLIIERLNQAPEGGEEGAEEAEAGEPTEAGPPAEEATEGGESEEGGGG